MIIAAVLTARSFNEGTDFFAHLLAWRDGQKENISLCPLCLCGEKLFPRKREILSEIMEFVLRN
jgi:hypothetical protein